jgi:hypothetical protein
MARVPVQSPLTRIRATLRSRLKNDQYLLSLKSTANKAAASPTHSRVMTAPELAYLDAMDSFRDLQHEGHRQVLLRNAERMMSMEHLLTTACGVCERLTAKNCILDCEITIDLKQVCFFDRC